jgi:hypothetical protein
MSAENLVSVAIALSEAILKKAFRAAAQERSSGPEWD